MNEDPWVSPILKVQLRRDADGRRSYHVEGPFGEEDGDRIHEWFWATDQVVAGGSYPTRWRDRWARMGDAGWWIGKISKRLLSRYRDWEYQRENRQ